MMLYDISHVKQFLGCETPDAWIEYALQHQSLLLIDHAHCEQKAAATAMSLMNRHADKHDLLTKMSKLAREELRHFEQVLSLLKKRDIAFEYIGASKYAAALRDAARKHDPAKFIDILIIGAFIEARSCERFAKLIPHLDDELAKFYASLLKSESRHYEDYLKLASVYSAEPIDSRVTFFRQLEVQLIQSTDTLFRFHSGIPVVV